MILELLEKLAQARFFAVAKLFGDVRNDGGQARPGGSIVERNPDMRVERVAVAKAAAGLHHRAHYADGLFGTQQLGQQRNVLFHGIAFGRAVRESQQPARGFIGPGDFTI